MRQTAAGDLGALRSAMASQVLLPGDQGYDEARALWNGCFDRRPAVIACCAVAADVAAAVRFGCDRGLEIAVRGGGHSYSGASAVDEGLMIHLGAMNAVAVDPGMRRARVGGGATWADVDAATQAHGLAVTGGVLSDTGVGGLTLGGGMGWLANRHGLTVDNLESAEVVLADGGDRPCLRHRPPGPVLGPARGRWQLRGRHRVRVPAAARAERPIPRRTHAIRTARPVHRLRRQGGPAAA